MSDDPDTGVVRGRLRDALVRAFEERSYQPSYLARRCRTTADVVESWRTGVGIPDVDQWSYLLAVSRDFRALDGLWREALEEQRGERSGHAATGGVEGYSVAPPTLVSATLDSSVPVGPDPAADAVGDRSVSDISTLAEVSVAAVAAVRAHPADDADLVVYVCKISGGRVIQLPMPTRLTRADVRRISAFLMSQADDFEVGPGG